MKVSVVIPTLDEQETLPAALAAAAEADEIIVVDGGSRDATASIAVDYGAQVIACRRGRGRQLECGARAAKGDVLLFVHADTMLPAGFRREIVELIASGHAVWGRFDLRFDRGGPLLRLIARLISLRSRLSRVATGDQAIFARRDAFDAVGGFHEPVLFEDVDLCRRLKRFGTMGVPRSSVVTSARRWRKHGTWRTTVRMWSLKFLYLCGVPSDWLERHYDVAR